MASELEIANSVSTKLLNETSNLNQLDDSDEDDGEWELAGAAKLKSKVMKSPKSMRNRRRIRRNSKTQIQINKSTTQSNETKLNDSSSSSSSSNVSISDKLQEIKTNNLNPWAKVPEVKPVAINTNIISQTISKQNIINETLDNTIVANTSIKPVIQIIKSTNLDSSDWPTLNTFETDLKVSHFLTYSKMKQNL